MLRATSPTELVAKNSEFYDRLWSNTYLTSPRHFNTWPLVASLVPTSLMRLEVGPGLRPRLPVAGTHFIDLSPAAVARLAAAGGLARSGQITELPFADDLFDLVVACDVIEHVTDDQRAFGELSRVLKDEGRLVFSVPLNPARWTAFDECVGHARRYDPGGLAGMIAAHGLVVEQSAGYGMRANHPGLLRFTVKGLTEHRAFAIRCYNWLFLPLGMMLQKRLKWKDGWMDLAGADEVLVVCRRLPRVMQPDPSRSAT